MPKIPIYQQRTSAQGPTQLAPLSTEAMTGGARGVGAVGQALRGVTSDAIQLREFEKQKAEERAAVSANEQAANARARWLAELLKRQAAASEDAAGFTPQILKDFDDDADERIKSAPTEASRAWLKDRLGQTRMSLQQDALGFEARRGVEYKANGLTRAIDGARTAAEFQPQSYQILAAEQIAAIDASGLPADSQRALRQSAVDNLSSAAVQGMIRRDPYSALQEINAEDSKNMAVRHLTFERRQMLRNSAEAEINRLESEKKGRLTEVRQALTDQMTDIRAAAANGMTITEVPPKAALVAAFGEQEGTQRYNQTLAFATLSPKISALYQAPAGEILKTVQDFKPTKVEGAADQLALMGIVDQKANAILEQREKDAGGYLAAHSALVQDAWNALQQANTTEGSDAAASKYLRAVRAEKERLGIQSQDVLPANYVDAVVDTLTKPQGAETLSTAMISEKERWGESWPAVYRQLSPKLPSAANIIGSGIPKRAADTLALMSVKDEKELKVLIKGGNSLENVRTKVSESLADFTESFGGEGSKVVEDMHDSVTRTAIGYMASGSSYSDAITQAADDIANSRYHFSSFRDQPYRMPVELDADLVDEGASFFLENYAQPSGTVQVPAGTPEKIILGQATDNIRRTSYWRTAPDESGLRLYVGNGVVPGVGGKPVQLSWEQLNDLARQSAADTFTRTQKEGERRMRGR